MQRLAAGTGTGESGSHKNSDTADGEIRARKAYFHFPFSQAYESLVRAFIRPPRDRYHPSDLGPRDTVIRNNLRISRTDFQVVNRRGQHLVCSRWAVQSNAETVENERCVIYLHGNSSSRLAVFHSGILNTVSNLGFSLIAFDFSGSGISGGQYVSLGYYEKDDVEDVISVVKRKGWTSKILLWGRSMGAVTALLYASSNPDSVAGLVMDSPYSSLVEVAKDLVADINSSIPSFLVLGVLQLVRRSVVNRAGFDIYDVEPQKVISKCRCPAFMLHGTNDRVVQPKHSIKLSNKYRAEALHVDFVGTHNSPRPAMILKSVAIFIRTALEDPSRIERAFITIRELFAMEDEETRIARAEAAAAAEAAEAAAALETQSASSTPRNRSSFSRLFSTEIGWAAPENLKISNDRASLRPISPPTPDASSASKVPEGFARRPRYTTPGIRHMDPHPMPHGSLSAGYRSDKEKLVRGELMFDEPCKPEPDPRKLPVFADPIPLTSATTIPRREMSWEGDKEKLVADEQPDQPEPDKMLSRVPLFVDNTSGAGSPVPRPSRMKYTLHTHTRVNTSEDEESDSDSGASSDDLCNVRNLRRRTEDQLKNIGSEKMTEGLLENITDLIMHEVLDELYLKGVQICALDQWYKQGPDRVMERVVRSIEERIVEELLLMSAAHLSIDENDPDYERYKSTETDRQFLLGMKVAEMASENWTFGDFGVKEWMSANWDEYETSFSTDYAETDFKDMISESLEELGHTNHGFGNPANFSNTSKNTTFKPFNNKYKTNNFSS